MTPLPTTQASLAIVEPTITLPHQINSAQLLRGQAVVEILHGIHRYQLRLTRENKLILTK